MKIVGRIRCTRKTKGRVLPVEHPAFKQAFIALYFEMMIQTHKERGLSKITEKEEIIQI
jgi:hypothetical protein